MVRLRLTRRGRRKRPFFRIVAADSRMPRDGRYIEVLGTYDPLKSPAAVALKQERVLEWLKKGAQPSVTGVSDILVSASQPGGAAMDELKALIEHMAKALVDKPDAVSVQETDGEKTTIIELRVAQDDLGKVIGKQGRTARSMRTILNAAGTKLGKRCVLEILE